MSDTEICEWNGRVLSNHHDLVNMYGGGSRCAKCKKEFLATVQKMGDDKPMMKIFGTWPGDETDEQLLAALSEVRKSATTEVRGKASPEMEQLMGRLREKAWTGSRVWVKSAELLKLLHHIEGKG